MHTIIAKLKANAKAWVSGVVAFVSTYVLLFYFGIDIGADLQATIASTITALVVGLLTWLFPNVPPAPLLAVPPRVPEAGRVYYPDADTPTQAGGFKPTSGTDAEQWRPPAPDDGGVR